MDEKNIYWQELSERIETIEYDYISDCINNGYIYSMNIKLNNTTGGKKSVEY